MMRINKAGLGAARPGRWRRLGIFAPIATMLFIGGCETVFAGPSLYSTVPVTVTTRAGAPIPGVALELYTGQRPIGYATTDSAGQFTFERVPPGLYGVRAIPPSGYATKESLVRGTPTTVIDNLRIGADTAATQRFVFLQVGTGSVTVIVRSTDGSPVVGAIATLYDPGATRGTAVTDVAGRATFNPVAFGVYGVRVLAPVGYHDLGVVRGLFTDDLIVDQGTTQFANFTFAPCTGSIAVITRDDRGQPIPSVPVTLYTASGPVQQAATGPDGTLRFAPLGCEEYGVSLAPTPGYTLSATSRQGIADGLRVSGGANLTTSFTLRSCIGAIRVLATDQVGAPVTGAALTPYSTTGGFATQLTGVDGRVVLAGLPCDRQIGVNITAPAGYSRPEGRGQAFLDGITFAKTDTIDVTFRLSRP